MILGRSPHARSRAVEYLLVEYKDLKQVRSAFFLLDQLVLERESGVLPEVGLILLGVEADNIKLLLLLLVDLGLIHRGIPDEVGPVVRHLRLIHCVRPQLPFPGCSRLPFEL